MPLAQTYAEYYGASGSTTGAATQIGLGSSIYCQVGEVKRYAIGCNQAIEELTLQVVFERFAKDDIATLADGTLGKEGQTVTLEMPAAVTAAERVIRYAITRTDTGEVVAFGLVFVTHVGTVDS